MSIEPDLDGDSAMLSSSSASSDAMFPSANDPPTPQNINHNDALPASELNPGTYTTPYSEHAVLPSSELSPPDSQDHNAPVPMGDVMDMEQTSVGGAGVMETGPDRGGGREAEEQNEPGWGWKNRKAQEDWGRALEMVVDKGFSLREFGDLFDERKANGERL